MIDEMTYNEQIISEISLVKNSLLNCLNNDELFFNDLKSYLSSPAKFLRSKLCILFQHAFVGYVTDNVVQAAVALELAHNASLLHDDVIDEAPIRRGHPSFNALTNDKTAILAGDFVISQIMLILNKISNSELFDYFAKAVQNMSLGEINQFYNRFNYPTLSEYFKKNIQKTGELFKLAVLIPLILSDKKEFVDDALSFAQNFSNAFQIRDDIVNYFGLCDEKPCKNDVQQGVYTLPELLKHENVNANLYEESCKILSQQVNLSLESLNFIAQSEYKDLIVAECKSLLKGI